VSKLCSVTGQLGDIQLDRDQLSARLEQLQKVVQQVQEGRQYLRLACIVTAMRTN